MKRRANTAVSNGPLAMVTSTLATGMSRMATMKAVNITLQHRPESHSAAPPRRMPPNTERPCDSGSSTSRLSRQKALRQKVTSKLRAASS